MKGKVCAKCGEWKTLEEYHKNKKTKDGRGTYCKECQKKYQKQWREKNPKYHNSEQQRQYRENNKERIKEYHKQYHDKNSNVNNGQIIFSSHNIIYLDSCDVRKDKIWSVEKNDEGSRIK